MEDLGYVWRQHFQILGHLLGSDTEGRARFGAGARVGWCEWETRAGWGQGQ